MRAMALDFGMAPANISGDRANEADALDLKNRD
jgi:hypothetical protein